MITFFFSDKVINKVIPNSRNYIKGQKEHHKKMAFAEEYRRFIEANEVAIDNRFFMKDA